MFGLFHPKFPVAWFPFSEIMHAFWISVIGTVSRGLYPCG